MAEPRAPAWWDGTWNPVGGCLAVSKGCKNCYAAKLAATQQTWCEIPLYVPTTEWVRGKPVFNGTLTVLPPEHTGWRWPLQWKGAEHPLLGPGKPSLIFVADMSDLFHEQRPVSIIDQAVGTIAASRFGWAGGRLKVVYSRNVKPGTVGHRALAHPPTN